MTDRCRPETYPLIMAEESLRKLVAAYESLLKERDSLHALLFQCESEMKQAFVCGSTIDTEMAERREKVVGWISERVGEIADRQTAQLKAAQDEDLEISRMVEDVTLAAKLWDAVLSLQRIKSITSSGRSRESGLELKSAVHEIAAATLRHIEHYYPPETGQPVAQALEYRPSGNLMVKVGGKPYRCECGCNVFTKLVCEGLPDKFKCNGCSDIYSGQPVAPEPQLDGRACKCGRCTGVPDAESYYEEPDEAHAIAECEKDIAAGNLLTVDEVFGTDEKEE